jgi:hypothetical protein
MDFFGETAAFTHENEILYVITACRSFLRVSVVVVVSLQNPWGILNNY